MKISLGLIAVIIIVFFITLVGKKDEDEISLDDEQAERLRQELNKRQDEDNNLD